MRHDGKLISSGDASFSFAISIPLPGRLLNHQATVVVGNLDDSFTRYKELGGGKQHVCWRQHMNSIEAQAFIWLIIGQMLFWTIADGVIPSA